MAWSSTGKGQVLSERRLAAINAEIFKNGGCRERRPSCRMPHPDSLTIDHDAKHH